MNWFKKLVRSMIGAVDAEEVDRMIRHGSVGSNDLKMLDHDLSARIDHLEGQIPDAEGIVQRMDTLEKETVGIDDFEDAQRDIYREFEDVSRQTGDLNDRADDLETRIEKVEDELGLSDDGDVATVQARIEAAVAREVIARLDRVVKEHISRGERWKRDAIRMAAIAVKHEPGHVHVVSHNDLIRREADDTSGVTGVHYDNQTHELAKQE